MRYWHINTYSMNNRKHMIKRNLCYIGLGNDRNDYNQRLLKNKNTTPHQYNKFEENARKGDIILLYHNGEGHIAYGKYTGVIIEPNLYKDLAPDWSNTEIQKHIQVESWIRIENISMKYVRRQTLLEFKNDPEKKFTELISIK